MWISVAAFGATAADDPHSPLYPTDLACEASGTILIADRRLPGIYRLDEKGRLDVLFQASPMSRTPLHSPRALAVGPAGTVFVADTATSEVYRLESGRPPVPLSGGMLEVPTGLAVAPTGDLLVTDLRLGLIARVPRDGGRPVTIATVPSPRGLALSPEGEPVVLSMGPSSVLRVNQDGKVVPLVTGKPFRFPCCILADPDHAGYLVSDSYGASIWAVSERGEVRVRIQGSPLVRPEGLAREPSGALLVADPGAGQVFRVGEGGAVQPLLPQLPKDEISQRGPCAGHSIERDTSR